MHSYDWYPMIRGRLIAVNGKAVSPDDYEEDRAKRLVDREFNISTAETMPDHNQIVGGRWQAGEQGAISMEEGIAKTLGLGWATRCASISAVSRARPASPACARWTGVPCAPTSL